MSALAVDFPLFRLYSYSYSLLSVARCQAISPPVLKPLKLLASLVWVNKIWRLGIHNIRQKRPKHLAGASLFPNLARYWKGRRWQSL